MPWSLLQTTSSKVRMHVENDSVLHIIEASRFFQSGHPKSFVFYFDFIHSDGD